MEKLLALINDFGLVSTFIRLILAAVFGGLIGSERGRHGRAAGMRTHILICLGAAVTALTGLFIAHVGGEGDISRISAQVISGIGFLGVGTILIRNNSVVTGLTTAAGMWATAAIGIAVGYGFYIGAALATVICIFTATVLTLLEKNRKNTIHFYAEISANENAGRVVDKIRNLESVEVSLEIINTKSNSTGRLGAMIDIKNPEKSIDYKALIDSIDGVCFTIDEAN